MKRNHIATSSLFLFSGIAVASWAPMVPFAKERLQLSESMLGCTLLIFGIGALLTMPLTGWLVTRWGSRIITLVGGLNVLWLIPFLTIAPSPLLLMVTLFLFGAMTGALNISMNAHAVLLEKAWKKPIMSSFHSLFSAGGLLGALLITFLLQWNCSLFLSSIIVSILLGSLLISQISHISLLENQEVQKSNPMVGVPNKRIIALGSFCFILFLTEGAMLDWSALFLRSSLEYDVTIAGIGFAIFSVFMALGRFLGDKIVSYLGSLYTMQMGSTLCALGLLITLYTHWGYSELLGFAFIGIGASNIVPILFSAAGHSGGSAAYNLTIVTTCGYAGLLLGPAFIGWIAEVTTLSQALTLLVFLMSIVAFGSSSIFSHAKQEQEI